MNKTVKIIVLNGEGSAGKSSIAKEMQKIAKKPFLHVQMDTFLEMMPDNYHDHPEGFQYQTIDDNGDPAVVIKSGPIGKRALRGMRCAMASMAEQGNNLISRP
ncbi:MAG: hypothetical protein HON65_10825 [Rhodospirillales bacterium]|nr:hypothetical protein [Rhodospirillales bacterium]